MSEPVKVSIALQAAMEKWERPGHPSLDASEPPTDEQLQREARNEVLEQQRSAKERRWAEIRPPRFEHVSWDSLNQPADVRDEMTNWLKEARTGADGNVVLYGPLGVGKTFAALALAREMFDLDFSVSFRPVVEMLDDLRREGRDLPLTGFTSPHVLVLDDLGAEKPSEWTMERFYAILNRRWLEKRPTIATCNFENPSDLREALGARSYDRLLDGAVAIGFAGASRRHPK